MCHLFQSSEGFAYLLALVVVICFLTAYCQLLANGWAYMGDKLYDLFPVIYNPCKTEQKCNFGKVRNGKHFVLASTHRALKSLVLEPPEPHAGAFQPFHSFSGFNSCLSWALGEIWLFCFPLVKDGKLVAPIALTVDPSAEEMMQR